MHGGSLIGFRRIIMDRSPELLMSHTRPNRDVSLPREKGSNSKNVGSCGLISHPAYQPQNGLIFDEMNVKTMLQPVIGKALQMTMRECNIKAVSACVIC